MNGNQAVDGQTSAAIDWRRGARAPGAAGAGRTPEWRGARPWPATPGATLRARRPGRPAAAPGGRDIELLAPPAERVTTSLREPIARCLAAAFGSGPWAATPMPLGPAHDRHSARGILAEFGPRAKTLVAATAGAPDAVAGCVIGAVLERDLVRRYGLGTFGARPGDGLFAYIGIEPAMQGRRLRPAGNDYFRPAADDRRGPGAGEDTGLASLLFSRWLDLPAIRDCPRVFIRTREILAPIRTLATRHGFRYCGRFYLDFHGVRQDRLVYRRTRA